MGERFVGRRKVEGALVTWPQEDVYHSKHGWTLQETWLGGLEEMAWQWNGLRTLWSRMS